MGKCAFSLKSEAGMSLISILVAIGLTGILATIMGTIWTNSFKTQHRLELKGDIASAKSYIKSQLDCEATLTPMPSCSSSTPVTLKKVGGGNLTTSNGLLYGNFYAAATCDSTSGTLVINLAKKDSAGNFMKDPLSNTPLDWNSSSNPLYGANLPICFEMFGASGSGNQPVKIVTENMTLSVASSVYSLSGSAICPSGYFVLSGGNTCRQVTGGITPSNSAVVFWQTGIPTSNNGWTAQCSYTSTASVNAGYTSWPTAKVYATCFKAP